MKVAVLFAAIALGGSVGAQAATVSVDVKDAQGQPLAGAIVTVMVPGTPAPTPHGTYTVAQENIAFTPHVLIVPVGAAVEFPNHDNVRHHVYSFSKTKKFDLKLYGKEEKRTVSFDKPGLVSLGCNIHDSMSGTVFVSATPYAAIADANGHVTIAGVPAGKASVAIWHPSIHSPDNSLAQPADVPAKGLSLTMAARR